MIQNDNGMNKYSFFYIKTGQDTYNNLNEK
jgi:hypothetical protein